MEKLKPRTDLPVGMVKPGDPIGRPIDFPYGLEPMGHADGSGHGDFDDPRARPLMLAAGGVSSSKKTLDKEGK